MANEEHQAQGQGNVLLSNTILEYLLTSDPYLGTSEAGVPNGAFNRELKKLLLNDSALANIVFGFINRTVGASGDAAPAVNTIPDPLPGASVDPEDKACAEVFFADFRVIYLFDTVEWIEIGRVARVDQMLLRHVATVRVACSTGVDAVVVTLPTEDDEAVAFGFTLADLKIFYLDNLVPESDFIAVHNGIRFTDPAVTFKLTAEPVDGADYELVCVFEHLSYLT